MNSAAGEAGRKALAKVVTGALDQASAGTERQIEAARKIGEAMITGAAQWSADQIRQAGEQAAERIRAEVRVSRPTCQKG